MSFNKLKMRLSTLVKAQKYRGHDRVYQSHKKEGERKKEGTVVFRRVHRCTLHSKYIYCVKTTIQPTRFTTICRFFRAFFFFQRKKMESIQQKHHIANVYKVVHRRDRCISVSHVGRSYWSGIIADQLLSDVTSNRMLPCITQRQPPYEKKSAEEATDCCETRWMYD